MRTDGMTPPIALDGDGVLIRCDCQPGTRRLDDDPIVLHRCAEADHVLPVLADRQLDQIVDGSLEEARAVRRVIALIHDLI